MKTIVPRLGLIAILLLAVIGFAGVTDKAIYQPSVSYTAWPEQRLLVIHHSADRAGEMALYHLRVALDLAHLEYDVHDVAQTTRLPRLDVYTAIVFVTQNLHYLDSQQSNLISTYVENGGGAAVLYHGYNRHLRKAFGMATSLDPQLLTSQADFQFVADLFPGTKGMAGQLKDLGGTHYLDIQTREEVEPIATLQGSERPVIWFHRFGHGRVIFWNNDWLTLKHFRGFAVQSILAVMPVSAQAIANWATIQVDDFPNATSVLPHEPIAMEYGGMRFVDWVHQVWLPDMQALSQEFGFRYSWYLVFNYNATVTAPFDFAEWTNALVEVEGQPVMWGPYSTQQVQSGGHELGLHGYNHVSLLSGNWSSRANMIAGLEAARIRWESDNLGRLPTTFTPPNNVYDADGLAALKVAFPTVQVIAGDNAGAPASEGGHQEFGPDPRDPHFYDLPRWTSGYLFDGRIHFLLTSELAMFGVWTHFVHPDDVVDIPLYRPHTTDLRNPENLWWRHDNLEGKPGLYPRFREMLQFVRNHFPWLRFVGTDEAYALMQQYDRSRVSFHFTQPNQLLVTFDGPPTYFLVRLNDGRTIDVTQLRGTQLISSHIGEGYNLYILRGIAEKITVALVLPESQP